VYKATGKVQSFGQMIDNIFAPLFEATVSPASHPSLHRFLQQCVGFDIVDDESVRERAFSDHMPTPDHWDGPIDPPYAYFCYYIFANLYVLNRLRQSKGFTVFPFRPHAGEAGDAEHLACTFLVAQSINHGIMLSKSPALQYLYYLSQMGISMSPLSNNLLFLEYDKNPFPRFFQRGLNVTLSTDDPLQISVTKEPLVEEYAVAAQVWKLSSVDVSEIARNSVLQSGWEHQYKVHFLGNRYWLRGLKGNDIRQTNVPAIRVQFRAELLAEELSILSSHADQPLDHQLVDPL
jgi:AMP deaminase